MLQCSVAVVTLAVLCVCGTFDWKVTVTLLVAMNKFSCHFP